MSNYNKPGPGKLISLRGREWMVLPSADEDVLLVRPLGGTDDEVIAARENPVIERIEEDSDAVPTELFSQAGLTIPETERLHAMHARLEELASKEKDRKSAAAISPQKRRHG